MLLQSSFKSNLFFNKHLRIEILYVNPYGELLTIHKNNITYYLCIRITYHCLTNSQGSAMLMACDNDSYQQLSLY